MGNIYITIIKKHYIDNTPLRDNEVTDFCVTFIILISNATYLGYVLRNIHFYIRLWNISKNKLKQKNMYDNLQYKIYSLQICINFYMFKISFI